jgi:hypothetical protein
MRRIAKARLVMTALVALHRIGKQTVIGSVSSWSSKNQRRSMEVDVLLPATGGVGGGLTPFHHFWENTGWAPPNAQVSPQAMDQYAVRESFRGSMVRCQLAAGDISPACIMPPITVVSPSPYWSNTIPVGTHKSEHPVKGCCRDQRLPPQRLHLSEEQQC